MLSADCMRMTHRPCSQLAYDGATVGPGSLRGVMPPGGSTCGTRSRPDSPTTVTSCGAISGSVSCRGVVQNKSQSKDDSLRGRSAADIRVSPDQASRADALDVLHRLRRDRRHIHLSRC